MLWLQKIITASLATFAIGFFAQTSLEFFAASSQAGPSSLEEASTSIFEQPETEGFLRQNPSLAQSSPVKAENLALKKTDHPTIQNHSKPNKGKLKTALDSQSDQSLDSQSEDSNSAIFYQKVEGQLTLSGGAAFTGQEVLSVYHIYRDQIEEIADVFIHEGKYSLVVDRRRLGRIVAELRSERGKLLGYGEGRFYKPDIKVKPLKKKSKKPGKALKVISGYSSAGVLKTVESQIAATQLGLGEVQPYQSSESLFSLASLDQNSDALISVSAKGYHSTLMFNGPSPFAFQASLFPQTFIDALMALSGVKASVYEGVVLGDVVDYFGAPVEGAQILVRSDNSRQAFYFSGPFLDAQSSTTDQGGRFFVPSLSGGMHILDVYSGGKWLFSNAVFVEPEHASSVRLSPQIKDNLEVIAKDVQSGKHKSVQLSFLTQRSYHFLDQGKGQIEGSFKNFSASDPYTYLDVNPGEDYLLTRHKVFREDHSANLPLFSFNWLNQFENFSSELPSVIVNLPKNTALVLSQDSERKYEPQYFDTTGSPTDKSNAAGVILKNIPPGFWSASIQDKQGFTLNQNFTVDPELTFVLSF